MLERGDATSEHSKAPGLHIRTREVLQQWRVGERFLEAGELVTRLVLDDVKPGRAPLLALAFSELEDEAYRPGPLILEQGHTEALRARTCTWTAWRDSEGRGSRGAMPAPFG
jgi:hypothetical protein